MNGVSLHLKNFKNEFLLGLKFDGGRYDTKMISYQYDI